MTIDAKHPHYVNRLPDWQQMIDTYAGERQVKAAGDVYLPPTKGMRAKKYSLLKTKPNSPVVQAYDDYKLRAQFPDFVHETTVALLGIMHRKEPVIHVPDRMAGMVDIATVKGESAKSLLRRINESQLVTGRVGLLLDPVDNGSAVLPPRIATYSEVAIMNWRVIQDPVSGVSTLVFLSLDESSWEMSENFTWTYVKKTRLLRLEDGVYQTAMIVEGQAPLESDWTTPRMGNRTLSRIPFVIINVTDVHEPSPDVPPLLGLSNMVLAIYRAEADYRQHLHECGQDTLVAIGAKLAKDDGTVPVGAGAVIDGLPLGSSVQYIGITSGGIGQQRDAILSDRASAEARAAHLIDTQGGNMAESGDALRIRVAARTASLYTIADAGAEGLATAMKLAAEWMGLDPTDVVVTPNKDFVDDEVSPGDLGALMSAHIQGFPISRTSMHAWAKKREFTVMTFEDEMEEIARENEDFGPAASPAAIDLG